MDLNELQPS